MRRGRSFTMVEIVLAAGMAGVLVAGMLAFLAPLAREADDAEQARAAARLMDAVEAELCAARDRMGGIAALAESLQPEAGRAAFELVAGRGGMQVVAPGGAEGVLPPDRWHFLIEVRRHPGWPEPAAGEAVLPLLVRVSWPLHVPAGGGDHAVVPAGVRSSQHFNLAVPE